MKIPPRGGGLFLGRDQNQPLLSILRCCSVPSVITSTGRLPVTNLPTCGKVVSGSTGMRRSDLPAQQLQATGPPREGFFVAIARLIDNLRGDSQIPLKRRLRSFRPAPPAHAWWTVESVIMNTKSSARMSASAESEAADGLLSRLGLYGLQHLDAPVLAALATQTPMLLIGPHGSAKSALLERLATALGLTHRHYNASLLSFDDLVGFPVPEGDGLKYLHTPATLWGAQSVFLDEISRCRPEVQNKLFSIIHERRVQGIVLEDLRYRWSAMNPPAGPDTLDEDDAYVGSVPLDPALADRFGFVLDLPAMEDLSPQARRQVIRSGLAAVAAVDGGFDLPALVEAGRYHAKACADRDAGWITHYTSALVAPLKQANLRISGRRAAMLAGNIAAVHGARKVLAKHGLGPQIEGLDALADSALCALRNGLPQRAQGKLVDAGEVASIHRQAVDTVTQAQADATLCRILDEAHPVRRVGMALEVLDHDHTRIPRGTMSLLVTDALAAQDTQARWVLSQELLPRIAALDCVDVPTLELLAKPFVAQVDFENRDNLRHQIPRSRVEPFNTLVSTLDALDGADPEAVALGNLGAALYASDEGAAAPTQLERQQHALREHLDSGARHAR